MKNENKFSMLSYVRFACFTSIVILLWGLASGLLQPSFVTWFAFAFFCILGIFSAVWKL